MNRYGELFLQEMSQKYEGVDVALETPVGKGIKMLLDPLEKEGKAHLKAGTKLYRAKKYKEAEKELVQAKKIYTELKNKAMREIDDEDTASWLVRLFIQPWWIAVFQLVEADFDLNATVRKSTVKQIDYSLKRLDTLIAMCKTRSKETI